MLTVTFLEYFFLWFIISPFLAIYRTSVDYVDFKREWRQILIFLCAHSRAAVLHVLWRRFRFPRTGKVYESYSLLIRRWRRMVIVWQGQFDEMNIKLYQDYGRISKYIKKSVACFRFQETTYQKLNYLWYINIMWGRGYPSCNFLTVNKTNTCPVIRTFYKILHWHYNRSRFQKYTKKMAL